MRQNDETRTSAVHVLAKHVGSGLSDGLQFSTLPRFVPTCCVSKSIVNNRIERQLEKERGSPRLSVLAKAVSVCYAIGGGAAC